MAEIATMLANGVYDREMAQAIIEQRIEIIENRDLVTVPDLSSGDLIELVKRECKFTNFDEDLAAWDFIRDECGKTYEVRVYRPEREVIPAEEIRAYFKMFGFFGNTAVFVAWIAKHNPKGSHASIPEDDSLFQRGDSLCALGFRHHGEDRLSDLDHDVRSRWRGRWSFVAFREVKPR